MKIVQKKKKNQRNSKLISLILFRRTTEFLQNDESQSSLHSSTSATVESSAKKIRSKIEVADPEGYEFDTAKHFIVLLID